MHMWRCRKARLLENVSSKGSAYEVGRLDVRCRDQECYVVLAIFSVGAYTLTRRVYMSLKSPVSTGLDGHAIYSMLYTISYGD